MDDLLEARRKSHEFRSSTMHDVVINNNGTMVGEALDETNTQLDIDAAMANMMGGMTAPEPVDSSLFNLTGADVADAAKAAGRAVLGGVQDAAVGVVSLADDIGGFIEENVGSLGYVRMGPNGFEYMRELPPGEKVMRMDDAFQAGLKNLGIDVPQGDSSAEAIARGLIQFGAGMAAAPVRGASYLSMMARGGFADALFDPEAGNLSTLLREYGLDNAVLEYLDSKVDEDADAAARLEARFKQSLEGAGLGIPIDMVITGFRLAKSNDGLRETIRNKLTTVKDRLTQPGDMPTTSAFGAGAIDEAKPSAAELRRQANIQRFGYDPNEVVERPSTGDEGFEEYLKTVNPSGKRIAAEDRPNLMMGDMYGMLPRGSEVISTQDGVTFYRSQDGDYYATAFNPDVGEEDVVGYITDRGDGTELAVVGEMQGQGIGGELQYLFRKENPNAPTGGLTEAGERSLQRTYERLREEGIVNGATSAPIGLIDEKPKGIKAFHGSGVDFDKFDLSFMGTGEGAQAYGKGLYFAEMEDVAQDYRQKLSGVLSNPLEEVLTPVDASPAAIAKAENDLKQAISFASVSFSPEGAARDFAAFTGRKETPELVEAFTQAMSNKGKMYEVRINADPNELLDFDAPISEQPKKVQEVIAPFVERRLDEIEAVGREEVKKAEKLGREFTPRTRSEILSTLKGGDILLLDKVETGQVSQALKDAGIPGIKYLDRKSRNKSFEVKLSVQGKPYATEPLFAANEADAERIADEYQSKGFDTKIKNAGSRNYVVLDDSLIDIVKKYGFGGFMVGAGVQSSLGVKESFEET